MIQNPKKEELKMSSTKRKKSHHIEPTVPNTLEQTDVINAKTLDNQDKIKVPEHQIVKAKKDSAEKLKETLDNTLPAKQEELQSQHGASQSLWS